MGVSFAAWSQPKTAVKQTWRTGLIGAVAKCSPTRVNAQRGDSSASAMASLAAASKPKRVKVGPVRSARCPRCRR